MTIVRREYVGLFLLGFLTSLGLFAVHPVLPLYAKQFGVSYRAIGYFFSAYALVWVFLQIYAGHLSDKYGRKKFVLLGLVVYGSFAFLCFTAQSFSRLLVFRMMQGVGLGLFGPAALGLAGGFKEKGKSMAVYRTSEAIGIIFGPILGGLIGEIGLSYPFLISMCAAFTAIACLPLLKEMEPSAQVPGFFGSLRSMLKVRSLLYICAAAFVAELCFASFDVAIPIVGEALGFSTKKIGFVIASYFIAFSLFQIPIGIISERLNKKMLLSLNALIAAIGFVILVLAGSFWSMVLAMVLLGITLGAVFVQSTAVVAELSPVGKKSLYLAFFDSIIDVSFVVMPPVVGWLLVFGEKIPFVLCVLLMVASASLISIGLQKERPNSSV